MKESLQKEKHYIVKKKFLLFQNIQVWLQAIEWFVRQKIWGTTIFLLWVILSWEDILHNFGFFRGIISLKKLCELRRLESSSFHLVYFMFILLSKFIKLYIIYFIICMKFGWSYLVGKTDFAQWYLTSNITSLGKLWISYCIIFYWNFNVLNMIKYMSILYSLLVSII